MSSAFDTSAWTGVLVAIHALVGLGLLVSYLDQHRPARAHWWMVSAVVAALVVGPSMATVQRLDLGLLPARFAAEPETGATVAAATEPSSAPAANTTRMRQPAAALDPSVGSAATSVGAPAPTLGSAALSEASAGPSIPIWRALALTLWITASITLLVRITQSWWRGRRLVRNSRPVEDPTLEHALRQACADVGLRKAELRSSTAIRSPILWCFGSQPRLLLASADRSENVDWPAILRHECAHAVRRDPWWSLAFELLVAALPWHPFAWWLARRHRELAEMACDDAAARGTDARVRMAESLLALAPQPTPAGVPAARCRGTLERRLRHLLWSDGMVHLSRLPRTMAALTLGAVCTGLALAQPRFEEGRDPGPARIIDGRELRGRVVDSHGAPIEGAEIALVGFNDRMRATGKNRSLARVVTDPSGSFLAVMPLHAWNEGRRLMLVAWCEGHGMVFHKVKRGREPHHFEFELSPECVVEGRVLDLQGLPVEGAALRFDSMSLPRDDEGDYRWINDLPHDLGIQSRMSAMSDADGRFRLRGLAAESRATVFVDHPEHAPKGIRFSTDESVNSEAGVSVTLAPARRLTGRVIDARGEPIAGAHASASVRSREWQWGGETSATTGDDGCFEVRLHEGAVVTLEIQPPPGAQSRAIQQELQWEDTTLHREVNLELLDGVVLKGRVVESDGTAVAHAWVRWLPQMSDNEHWRDSDPWENGECVTDSAGRFTMTVVPGPGHLAVRGGDDYVAQAVEPFELDPRMGGFTSYYHGLVRHTLAPDRPQIDDIVVTLERGVTLCAQVESSIGQPVVRADVISPSFTPREVRVGQDVVRAVDGRFQLRGLNPAAPTVLYAIDAEGKEGATLRLEPGFDHEQVHAVRLQPCGRARVRLLDESGEPLRNRSFEDVGLSVVVQFRPGSDQMTLGQPVAEYVFGSAISRETFRSLETDADGFVEIAGLIPGAPHRLLVDRTRLADLEVAAGECLELGDLRVTREGPMRFGFPEQSADDGEADEQDETASSSPEDGD